MVLKISNFFFLLTMLFSTLVVGLINNILKYSSYVQGLSITVFLLLFYVFVKKFNFKIKKRFLLIITFFLCHLLFVYFFTGVYTEKSFLSILFLSLLFICSYVLYDVIYHADEKIIIKTTNFFFLFLIVIGYIAYFLQKIGYIKGKNMIIFSEPSHFAIVLTPMFLFVILNLNKIKSFFYFLLVFLLAFLIKNLTLLISAFIGYFIVLKSKKYNFVLILFSVFILSITGLDKFEYFYKRLLLDTKDEISNRSSLVYLSGWEEAYYSLINTNLIGYGFNQMGFLPQNGYFRHQLKLLASEELNIYDGGTTGAKLVYELGFIGVVVMFFYLYGLLILYKKIKHYKISDPKLLFFISYYIAFFIELFIRGIGYFSPNIILTLTSFYALFVRKSFLQINIASNELSAKAGAETNIIKIGCKKCKIRQ